MPVYVIADDAGAVETIDSALDVLIQAGILDGVAAFANFDGLGRCRGWRRGGISVGIHLNLSTGKPVLPGSEIASLVDSSGRFRDPRDQDGDDPAGLLSTYVRDQAGRVREVDLEKEFRAQVDRFCSVLGHSPDFVSVHHDLDVLEPVRSAADAVVHGSHCRDTRRRAGALDVYEYSLHPRGVAVDTVIAYLCRVLEPTSSGSVEEIICHPAERADGLNEITVYCSQRVAEFRALLSTPVRDALIGARSV